MCLLHLHEPEQLHVAMMESKMQDVTEEMVPNTTLMHCLQSCVFCYHQMDSRHVLTALGSTQLRTNLLQCFESRDIVSGHQPTVLNYLQLYNQQKSLWRHLDQDWKHCVGMTKEPSKFLKQKKKRPSTR